VEIITVWIAMVDTSIENGCLQVLPDVREDLQLPDTMSAPVLLLPLRVEELCFFETFSFVRTAH
jgi:ectoine hydroxylase-related dioxygenase (phytanoyl-CoA dioxygenase family)